MKRITLKEVAEEAKISLRTVSRVLGGSDLVSVKTKIKIFETIKKLNYTPNLIARSLKQKSSNCIGIIFDDLTSPCYGPIIYEIESIVDHYNYSIFLCNSNYNQEKEKKHISNLINRYIDGIIISPLSRNYKTLEDIARLGIKVIVLLDYKAEHIFKNTKNIGGVYSLEFEGILEGMQFLINNGHKKIVFINSCMHIHSNNFRFKGYKNSLQKNNLEFDKNLVFNIEPYLLDGYNIAEKIFKKNINFTSIFCFNDMIALGVLKYCNENNIKIPDDFSIIGFDNLLSAQISNPPLTTIGLSNNNIGKIIAEMLFDKIKNKEKQNPHFIYTPKVILRDSVKKII